MMGKYLNGYLQSALAGPRTYVPPGWNEWDVAGWGYPEYGYPMNINGAVHRFGHSPGDYLTERDQPTRRRLHRRVGQGPQAVLPGVGDVHAPLRRSCRRPATPRSFPGSLRRAPPTSMCCRPMPRAGSRAARRCSPARSTRSIARFDCRAAGRAVDRPHDRQGRGGARRRTGSRGTPTSCSAPITVCTPASTGSARQADRLRHRHPRPARRRRSGRSGRRDVRRSPRTSTSRARSRR